MILHRFVHINVIRGDAGLAAVHVLSEDDASGRQLDVCGFIHDARALTPQLQGERSQMFRRLLHHQLTHRLATGEEDKIKFLIQQVLIFLTTSGNYRHIILREAGLDDLLHHRAGGRRIGTWFYHGRVSRSNGIHQRIHGEQERIIPRAHDQNRAQWCGFDVASGVELCQRRAHPAILRKTVCVSNHIGDLIVHHSDFAHEAFVGPLSQVGLQRVTQLSFIPFDAGFQCFHCGNSMIHIQGGSTEVILLLQVSDSNNFRAFHNSFFLPMAKIHPSSLKGDRLLILTTYV